MASVDETYTLRVGANVYPVSRRGTTCIINVPPDFFSPRRIKEGPRVWLRRVSRPFYLDLNKIPLIENASVASSEVTITMEQPNNWGNIVVGVANAFQAHLDRKARGDYDS